MLKKIPYTLLLIEVICEKKISTCALFSVSLNKIFFTNNEPHLTHTSLVQYSLQLVLLAWIVSIVAC